MYGPIRVCRQHKETLKAFHTHPPAPPFCAAAQPGVQPLCGGTLRAQRLPGKHRAAGLQGLGRANVWPGAASKCTPLAAHALSEHPAFECCSICTIQPFTIGSVYHVIRCRCVGGPGRRRGRRSGAVCGDQRRGAGRRGGGPRRLLPQGRLAPRARPARRHLQVGLAILRPGSVRVGLAWACSKVLRGSWPGLAASARTQCGTGRR